MTARIGTELDEAVRRLRAGELVAIPTETVYGLAANALDARACLRIFEAKRRPAFDPLIVHVRSPEHAREFARELPADAERLMRAFWPGPLTLVLPKRELVPDIVTSGLDTVALRAPAHPLTAQLLARLEFPLAAPSANLFGRMSPTRAEDVVEQLGDELEYVLDGGPCAVGVESTILGWEEGRCVLYRPGGTPLELIEPLIGPVRVASLHSEHAPRVAAAAPGMLAAHYAPRTPLVIEASAGHPLVAGEALLAFRHARPAHACEVLSATGDLREAASRLFAALRRLDRSGAVRIVAELAPERGLGRAINDRLRRAAAAST
jgi:L-threonylcarbamoyladenylate synthase